DEDEGDTGLKGEEDTTNTEGEKVDGDVPGEDVHVKALEDEIHAEICTVGGAKQTDQVKCYVSEVSNVGLKIVSNLDCLQSLEGSVVDDLDPTKFYEDRIFMLEENREVTGNAPRVFDGLPKPNKQGKVAGEGTSDEEEASPDDVEASLQVSSLNIGPMVLVSDCGMAAHNGIALDCGDLDKGHDLENVGKQAVKAESHGNQARQVFDVKPKPQIMKQGSATIVNQALYYDFLAIDVDGDLKELVQERKMKSHAPYDAQQRPRDPSIG
ncbi:hypothetical protein U1Q18_011505, partial [Sarracenia purpurea var. burkii]